ncbi:RsmB/NOP family class I SAM-dependent RNA methyltransferase [Methanopyrus sp.]
MRTVIGTLIDALTYMEDRGYSLKAALRNALRGVSGRRHRFVQALAHELVRVLGNVDLVLNGVLRGSTVEDLHPYLRNALRVGTWEIHWRREHPGPVTKAVVDVVKERVGPKHARFANAILRQVERVNPEDVINSIRDPTARFAARYNFPKWYVELVRSAFNSITELRKFLEACNRRPVRYVRVNTLVAPDPEEVVRQLRRRGIEAERDSDVPDVLRIKSAETPVIKTPEFKRGVVYPQTKASAAVAHAAEPEPGMVVVDLCAAPGGKTTHLAQLMEGRGEIVAIDVHPKRFETLKKRVKQFHADDIVETLRMDARDAPDQLGEGIADLVLVDPPCTGTGSVYSKPEKRWDRETTGEPTRWAQLQWELLKVAVRLLKPGGRIVYSTCSITLTENERLIERLVRRYRDLKLVNVPLDWASPGVRMPEARRIWPHRHDTDGFFVARVEA